MKKTLWILLALLVLLQLVPSNRPHTVAVNPGDLLLNTSSSAQVTNMLRNACYDCHSNESVFPWYAYVAPVSFLVNRDIREGRKELNFSEWENLSKKEKLKLLDEISTVVLDGEMPMKIYPPLHPEAKLSKADREKLAGWADELAEDLFND